GPEYLIPRPFDPRLMLRIAPAVAQAAMASGVATRPLADLDAYRGQLQQFVYHSGTFMKPIFATAKKAQAAGRATRVVFAEGEEERVMRAAQVVVDEAIARPILVGRPDVIERRLERFALRMRADADCEVVNALADTHVNLDPTAEQIAEITLMAAEQLRRLGISPQAALISHSNFGTSDAASAVKMRDALALIRAREPQLPVDGEMHADCAVDAAIRQSL